MGSAGSRGTGLHWTGLDEIVGGGQVSCMQWKEGAAGGRWGAGCWVLGVVCYGSGRRGLGGRVDARHARGDYEVCYVKGEEEERREEEIRKGVLVDIC